MYSVRVMDTSVRKGSLLVFRIDCPEADGKSRATTKKLLMRRIRKIATRPDALRYLGHKKI